MSQEEQGKKTSPVVSDAAVKEVIPAKPDKPTALSDEDLDNVAAGRDRGELVIIQRKSINDDYRDSTGKGIDAN